MDLRELRAFVAVAEELHFGRAAARLYIGPSSLSELIRRLELELGTPLLTRTTRKVELTEAGTLLLDYARQILGLSEAAEESVAEIARGVKGTVRVGMTPPVSPLLMPHITAEVSRQAAGLVVEAKRMWLPDLGAALAAGEVDVGITCDRIPEEYGDRFATVELGAERLLVGLRNDHPLAGGETVELAPLAEAPLGMHPRQLFPAWYAAQLTALADAGVDPPMVELTDTDLAAGGWTAQAEVEWILRIGSLGRPNGATVVLPVIPRQDVPFTLSWLEYRSEVPSIRRFMEIALRDGRPEGWATPRPAR